MPGSFLRTENTKRRLAVIAVSVFLAGCANGSSSLKDSVGGNPEGVVHWRAAVVQAADRQFYVVADAHLAESRAAQSADKASELRFGNVWIDAALLNKPDVSEAGARQ